MKTLNELEEGKKAIVVEILGGKGVRERLLTHGIDVGYIVIVKKSSLLGGPILIDIHGNEVELGRGVSSKIQVQEL
jgi:ferrous iron transport protein A